MTSATTPPTQVTDEASREGLKLAAQAGDAYHRMVEYFVNNVANDGAMQPAGEYLVGVAVEEAEPLWKMLGGQLALKEPAADLNAHLEVVVMDGADHRFIPQLMVHVVVSRGGNEVGTYRLPLLWHPTMFHYGRSIHIAEDGEYELKVCIETPTFGRHDKVNGKRYADPVTVTFDGINLKRGRKT